MAASFPGAVPTFTTKVDAVDTVQAAHVNAIQDEITAIGTDLLAAWTAVTFGADQFTGNDAMTWTVAEADVLGFRYKKSGRNLTVAFALQNTTVGGTPSTALQIAIPGSYVAAAYNLRPVKVVNNGTHAIGTARVIPTGTTILIELVDQANWAAATNTTAITGDILIETTT